MSAEPPHDLDSLEGFERLYRAYYGYAWAVLVRLGVPPASVDDAHQDVFVTAYRRRDTFQRGRSVKPWLVGIARRVAFRYRRTQRRTDRKQSALSLARGRERPTAGSFDARVEAGQFLQAFIDALEPEQREVFVLAELEGYSGPEITERLGINLNTAYTRIRAARMQLRRALGAVEERRASEARVERGLALLLPELSASKPGWVALAGTVLAKAKVGIAAGAVGIGVAAAVVIGGGGRGGAGPAEGEGVGRVGVVGARIDGEGGGVDRGASAELATPEASAPSPATAAIAPSPASTDASRSERRGAAVRAGPGRREGAVTPVAGAKSDDAASDLQREVETLTAVREELAADRPAEALARLDAHAKAHPSSPLDEARGALRVACLCALGRGEQARREAEQLRRRHPGSTVASHATTRCDEPPAGAQPKRTE